MPINLPDYADGKEERKLESEYKALRRKVLKNYDPSVLDKAIVKKVIPSLKDALDRRKSELNFD
jgi:hypothetical protein